MFERGDLKMMRCNCTARPRPMMGCHQKMMGHHHMPMMQLETPVLPFGGGCHIEHCPQPEVVVEPAIVAAPNIFHHHKNVQHIQPVITQDIHNYHSHHQYVAQEQKQADEVVTHAHGLCGPATTQPAKPCGCPHPCRCR